MKNEIWKDVVGYEGHYQVSNKGRVKSLKYGKEQILKNVKNGRCYLQVDLLKNGEEKTYYLHRIVAQVFLPNPQNLPQINHKDENKTNNFVENLEWCSSKYNNNYGTHNQRSAEKRSKTVLQFDKYGNFIREWKSARDIERNLGYNNGYISSCCNGKFKSAYGFVWKYK